MDDDKYSSREYSTRVLSTMHGSLGLGANEAETQRAQLSGVLIPTLSPFRP